MNFKKKHIIKIMKSLCNKFLHFTVSLGLILSSMTFTPQVYAETDTLLDGQKAECAKNTAAEWSASMNKCVSKVEAKKDRNEAIDCNKLTDLPSREACHKKLAEQKTGLDSNPDSLNTGNTGKSMIMNGINTVYAALNYLNVFGSSKKNSGCMSKKIFGVTALAGTASDFYLRARAKGKVDDLKDKYKLDVKNGASDAQVKALEYLKDEQKTVADIASMEKKRNMLLMIGYGAATAMALYELTPMGQNAECNKPEIDCKKDPEQEGCKKTCLDGTIVANGASCKKTCSNGAVIEEAQECLKDLGEEVVCGESSMKEGNVCVPKPPAATVAKEEPAKAAEKVPEKQVTAAADKPVAETPAAPAAAAPKTATIEATTKTVNGKEVAYYNVTNPNDPSKSYYIVDDKVYSKGSNTLAGKINYSTGDVNIGGTSAFKVGDVKLAAGGNSTFVPSGSFTSVHNKIKGGGGYK